MAVKTLVLGVGNILLQDEGVGVQALERLRADYDVPPGVELIDGGVMGLDLLPCLDGVTHLLIIDAVESGQPAGTLIRLEGEAIRATLALKMSIHQVGLQEVLAAGTLQGMIPAHIVLWGMQPACFDWGTDLSAVVAAQLDPLVEAVAAELDDWGLPTRRRGTARRTQGSPPAIPALPVLARYGAGNRADGASESRAVGATAT